MKLLPVPWGTPGDMTSARLRGAGGGLEKGLPDRISLLFACADADPSEGRGSRSLVDV